MLITDSITDSNCCEVIFQNKKHTAYAFDVFNEKRAHLALVPVGFVEIPGKAMVRIGRAGYEYLDRTIQIEKVNFPVSPQIFLVRKPTAAGKERRRQETEILLNIYSNEISERYFDGSLKFTSLLAEMETTSPFGKIRRKRMHNNGKEIRWDHYHGGVDLRARVGTPVFAAESGIARIAQKWLGSGNTNRSQSSARCRSSFRFVAEVRRQPALEGSEVHAFAPRVIFDLILAELADREILRLGM